jgi:hypothetical protein
MSNASPKEDDIENPERPDVLSEYPEGQWICTDPDTNQWLQPLKEGFRVYDEDPHGRGEVNFFNPRTKSEEELNEIVDGYYPSIGYVREVYGSNNQGSGSDWAQVVAEIQSEKKVVH